MNDYVEIFRAGAYSQGNFTETDIEGIVNNFKKVSEVPLTLDHFDKGPSFGWVDDVVKSGASLFAKFRDVGDYLKFLVNEKLMPKRSVELIPLEDGTYRLRAVTFLGAISPAVKNMPDFQFNSEEKAIYIDFENSKEVIQMSDTLKMSDDKKEKDVSIKKEQIPDPILLEEVRKTNQENDMLKLRIFAIEKEREAEKDKAFVDTLMKEGKVIPAMVDAGLLDFMSLLPSDEVVKFGEKETNPKELFKQVLSSMPIIIEFKEKTKDYTLPDRKLVFGDDEETKLLEKVKAIQKEKGLSFNEAFDLLAKEVK